MAHPICGGNLRRGTKVVAFGDAILSGLTIFTGIVVLNSLFYSVTNPEASSYAIGAVIIFLVLMAINVYLTFRLYRSAHERNVERLKQYRETSVFVLIFAFILAVFIRHTVKPDPVTIYPQLWFYILCILGTVFRSYMYLVVKAFLEEFELP